MNLNIIHDKSLVGVMQLLWLFFNMTHGREHDEFYQFVPNEYEMNVDMIIW